MIEKVEGSPVQPKEKVASPKVPQWQRRGPMMDRKVLAEEARKSEELRKACDQYVAQKGLWPS